MTENDTHRQGYRGADLTDACKDSEERTPSCYEEKMFEERSLQIIRDHNASDVDHPLFLFHSFHLLHTPLQIPKFYYAKIAQIVSQQGGQVIDSENRRLLMAMTMYLDDTIKNLTDALKTKGMWDNTLLVFTTDNGGPIYEPGSANNYPLRGGKYSDFEGGVRTNTFISGGFIPASSRGRIHNGIVSVADWYTIFSELAGVDPTDTQAESANVWLKAHNLTTLAPVDGKRGQLDAIFQGAAGPRANESLFISATALLSYPYKLVTGKQPYMVHTGPLYPNCTTVGRFVSGGGPDFVDFGVLEKKIDLGDAHYWRGDCGDGCLFNIEEDPSESHDLSQDPKYQAQLKQMIGTLADFNKTLFLPERGETDVKACYSMMLNAGGHFGPFVDIESYYTQPPRSLDNLTTYEKLQMTAMGLTEIPPIKELIQEYIPKVALGFLEKTVDKCCTNGTCSNATESESLDLTRLVLNASQKLISDESPKSPKSVYV